MTNMSEIRCFFNQPGGYYELISYAVVYAHYNYQPLSLGFRKGAEHRKLQFRPVDPTEPIMLAVGIASDAFFVLIDEHLSDPHVSGMRNYKEYKSMKLRIESRPNTEGKGGYWSVTSEGKTFVFGDVTFPANWPFEPWKLDDGDMLCAFVAGEISVGELRKHAYLAEREAKKELRRQEHIRRLSGELKEAKVRAEKLHEAYDLSRLRELLAGRMYNELYDALYFVLQGRRWPWIMKRTINRIIAKEEEE